MSPEAQDELRQAIAQLERIAVAQAFLRARIDVLTQSAEAQPQPNTNTNEQENEQP